MALTRTDMAVFSDKVRAVFEAIQRRCCSNFRSRPAIDAGAAKVPAASREPEHPAIAELQARYQAALATETALAFKHRSDPYWSSGGHNIGDDELSAVEYAQGLDLVSAAVERGDPIRYGMGLLKDLESIKDRYRLNERDPDGYGIGTLHSIAREMRAACTDLESSVTRVTTA